VARADYPTMLVCTSGTKYSRCFNAWIEENGFASMPFGIRAACLRVADHLEDIELWRPDLPGDARAAQNHPQVILRNLRRATGMGAPRVNTVISGQGHWQI
jgi:hypothetical protein